MKKKGYYEYIPQIYPRRLWVMYNTSEEEIDKCFTDMKGKPLVHNDSPMNEGKYGGMVYDEGAIYFKNKEDAQAVIDNPNFRSILDAIYKD